ncbi:BtpA family protein [Antarctobacter heliothermus]|uniref:BtpA family protein n=1 Tax=Antarctobacter heliothermus TaxID=74033 RepID=A0A222E1K6_9RHOB|nr:BtpA/SgcQ family protein [Antarctobacter heliothermus]ASP20033.1 BtpA family protein [Antarctobacter heliothermus]MBT52120.1 phosphoric monoester hydrolase [Mameliella sp.]|tara:strand:- start:594 stop:1397 length:804 start_codon:yes stop_codon:yes gene_type:complete
MTDTTQNPGLSPRPGKPFLVAALHLPDLSVRRHLSPAFLEDYTLANTEALVSGGIDHVILQDQTRQKGEAAPETVALTAALGRTMKRAFPEMSLGIIVQAHDACAPIAIAHASGADFVRLKIFVGAAMTFEGHREALAVEAVSYRHRLQADNVAIMADVFDRTCVPTIAVTPERAAVSAVHNGADALVITGSDVPDSLARIRAARGAGVKRPILIGGSVTAQNAQDVLAAADGAIVSSSLMRPDYAEGDLLRWDAGLTRALVDAAAS